MKRQACVVCTGCVCLKSGAMTRLVTGKSHGGWLSFHSQSVVHSMNYFTCLTDIQGVGYLIL